MVKLIIKGESFVIKVMWEVFLIKIFVFVIKMFNFRIKNGMVN